MMLQARRSTQYQSISELYIYIYVYVITIITSFPKDPESGCLCEQPFAWDGNCHQESTVRRACSLKGVGSDRGNAIPALFTSKSIPPNSEMKSRRSSTDFASEMSSWWNSTWRSATGALYRKQSLGDTCIYSFVMTGMMWQRKKPK